MSTKKSPHIITHQEINKNIARHKEERLADFYRFRDLRKAEQQRLWDEEQAAQRRFTRRLWCCLIFIAVLSLAAFTAFAEVGQDELEAAKTQAAASMQQAWKSGTESQEQPVNKTVANDGSVILAQNAPRQIVMTPDGPGLSDRHTTITVIQQPAPTPAPRPIFVEKGKASTHNRINGLDFDSSLDIPEGTDASTLQTLETATVNATQRYQQKLENDYNKAVLSFNSALYELQTTRASSVLWALIPLLMCLSGCGIGIYLAVTSQRQKKIKLENHIIER